MSSVTIAPVIYKYYQKKDGTTPIRVRVTYNRKNRVISTNLRALPGQLKKDMTIKDVQLQGQVLSLVQRMQMAANKIDTLSCPDMTADDVVKKMLALMGGEDFSLEFFSYAESIAAEKTANSRTNYMCAIHSFGKYVKLEKMDISLITSSMMRGYEAWLREKYGQGARAVSMYPSAIAYIHRRAQQEFNNEETGEINIRNPFAHYKPPRQKAAKHRNFDASLIKRMLKERGGLSGRERLGVDLFLLSFALMGMNVPDLFTCRRPDRGVLIYNRTKTKDGREDRAEMHVRIEKAVLPLYAEYADGRGSFAFNFHDRYSNYKNLGRAANVGLKEFKERIGYDKDIVMYSARHTWASVAYSAGIDKSVINDALCHVDPAMRVTDIYVQKNWAVIWKANVKVLRRVGWN